jgi:hypothetical protein
VWTFSRFGEASRASLANKCGSEAPQKKKISFPSIGERSEQGRTVHAYVRSTYQDPPVQVYSVCRHMSIAPNGK